MIPRRVHTGAALICAGLLGAAAGAPHRAAADLVPDLYQGEAIVTGQENLPERRRGFRQALEEVLIKVSGDDRIAHDHRLQGYLEDAEGMVADFAYRDRLAGKKLMDEQGTRERSYLLTVDFDPRRIDQTMTALDAKPWDADRPRLLVVVEITDSVGSYMLGMDSDRGYGQREAFLSVAQRRGLPLVLPYVRDLGAGDVSLGEDLRVAEPMLDALKQARGADAVLIGRMTMTATGAWDTHWRIRAGEPGPVWDEEGTTFDRAIAAALGRSAGLLAGVD